MLRNNEKLAAAVRIIKNKWVKRLLWVVGIGTFLLLLLFFVVLYVAPRIRFWHHTEKCGHYPVLGFSFAGSRWSLAPEDYRTEALYLERAVVVLGPADYFCTIEEAEKAYYEHR